MNKITSLSVSAAVMGALIVGFGFHDVFAKTVSYAPFKDLIMKTKAGTSTVGAFLYDVLPRFQNSYWSAPVPIPGSVVEPLIYSSYNNTKAYILFDIKDDKVFPADQISQAILKANFPTAYALMLSEASGAIGDGYGNHVFTSSTPIFAANTSTYAAMLDLRNSSISQDEEGAASCASSSEDDSDSADAVSDAGGGR